MSRLKQRFICSHGLHFTIHTSSHPPPPLLNRVSIDNTLVIGVVSPLPFHTARSALSEPHPTLPLFAALPCVCRVSELPC